MMNRRGFLSTAGSAAAGAVLPFNAWSLQAEPPIEHRLPATDGDYQRADLHRRCPRSALPLGIAARRRSI
jgi:hypothetical protein